MNDCTGSIRRPTDYERLVHALALVVGTESLPVFKPVLRLGESEAGAVRRWMIVPSPQRHGGPPHAKSLSYLKVKVKLQAHS